MSALPQSALLDFRCMTFSDLESVYRLERSAYAVPWTRQVFLGCLHMRQDCWLLCQDKDIVGYIIFASGAQESHLLNICVDPAQQGKGYGRELLRFMLDRVAVEGVRKVILEVDITNQHAIDLYESEGFQKIGVRKNYYPTPTGRQDAAVMARLV